MIRILAAALGAAVVGTAGLAQDDDGDGGGDTGNSNSGDTGGQTSTETGGDLSGVRVHTDSAAADTADNLGARALTTGRDVQLGPRSGNPGSRNLMAHELAHTLQQQSQASDGEADDDEPSADGRRAEQDARTRRQRQSTRSRRDDRPQ
ncbi:DUF4157 domain-containing protein [Maricaulis sp.]|uniref:eCIS core domain-containing protein n=1 Tax=Maricaulis sp. TaxID=1486257 RepID=UPI0026267000|nr:DUF4157 domain-containing protein [Maricaulis sp.]